MCVYFKVCAINLAGDGETSTKVSVKTLPEVCFEVVFISTNFLMFCICLDITVLWSVYRVLRILLRGWLLLITPLTKHTIITLEARLYPGRCPEVC